MKPIYEIHLPTCVDMSTFDTTVKAANDQLGEDYHIVVLVDQEKYTKTRIIYPTATFWGWWYNLWNA